MSAQHPRIINPIFFIRGEEPRQPTDLLAPVEECIRLLRENSLPATFLLQYDALQQERFVSHLKALSKEYEIGVWLELVQPLVEQAGQPWKGRWAWDYHSNCDYPIGYPPEARRKMIDGLMASFRETFGYYPRSVGSWVLDAPTLGYLADRYGVTAACNCKDQVGTDGYTLWGGYWNQAFYPSRKNAYMPAQNASNQIPIPIFRMLGSDPIYQYDANLGSERQGVVTLEPVYPEGGGSPQWIDWFLSTICDTPCLSFGYAQAGQENSFGWPGMERGLTYQMKRLAELARREDVRVETLADSGKWFRERYPVTPAAAVTALTDWKKEGHRAIWYNSRFYRTSLSWEGDQWRIRDIHRFDERYAERYLNATCPGNVCTYDTLPVLDGYYWSTPEDIAGIRLVGADGRTLAGGDPKVEEVDEDTLRVTWPLQAGGALEIRCLSDRMEFRVTGSKEAWALAMTWSAAKQTAITGVAPKAISYTHEWFAYTLRCVAGQFAAGEKPASIRITPEDGRIVLLPA